MKGIACIALVASAGCRPATQVTVDVTTDVACSAQRGTSVTVGRHGSVDGRAPGAVTSACATETTENRVGSIVLVPGEGGDAFGLAIILGVDRPVEECARAGYVGCIVARRAMSFVDHTELFLPVSLAERCKSVACDPLTTCVDGECVDATVRDPGSCTDATACDDDSLGGKAAGGSGGAGSGGGGGGGGGAGGSGGSAPGCGGPGVLVDDFETSAPSPDWVVVGSVAAASRAGGVLTLLPIDSPLVNYVIYRSRHAVDLRGRAMRVAVPSVAATGSQRTSLTLGFDDAATGAWITFEAGLLKMALFDASQSVGEAVEIQYDAGEHHVWQLREEGGGLHWETSADGAAWTTHRTEPMPAFLLPAYMQLRTGAAPGIQTKEAVFDDFNAGVSAEPWCPVSTLADDFDDGVPGPAWWPSSASGTCQMNEMGGIVALSGSPGSICQRRSAAAFDLQESFLTLELDATLDVSGGGTAFLEVVNDDGDAIRVARDASSFALWINGAAAGSMPFDPSLRFWRIARASTDVTAGASADGSAWTTVTASNVPLDLGAVEARFGLDIPADAANPASMGVTAVNP